MVKVTNQVIGEDTFKTFHIREDGFWTDDKKNDGFVEAEFRMLDGESEGVGMTISVFDHKVIKNGDYSPLNLEKEELKKFIQYMIECYKKM